MFQSVRHPGVMYVNTPGWCVFLNITSGAQNQQTLTGPIPASLLLVCFLFFLITQLADFYDQQTVLQVNPLLVREVRTTRYLYPTHTHGNQTAPVVHVASFKCFKITTQHSS